MAVSNICSLCFASADSSEDVEFVQIDKFASFLRDLAECEVRKSTRPNLFSSLPT